MSGRVKQHWDVYEKQVVPQTASRLQVEELRDAFYAGAIALFFEFTEAAADPRSVEEGALDIGEINDELNEYYEAFKRRHGVQEVVLPKRSS